MDRYPLTDFWLQVLRHVFIVRQRTSSEMDSSRLVDFAKFFSFAKLRNCGGQPPRNRETHETPIIANISLKTLTKL